MTTTVQLIGIDGKEIVDLDTWFVHAPPEGGEGQWVDGHSAKEQARAWLRAGHPAVPVELEYLLGVLGPGDATRWTGFPEHRTRFDRYSRGSRGLRHHDMLLLLGDPEQPDAVVGVEAKACENYAGQVKDKVKTAAPTRAPARCNAMAQALFGRDVCDATLAVVTDEALGEHGYQLWTGSAGTITEAQGHGLTDAYFVVQQFVPGQRGPAPGDIRNWKKALADNAAKLGKFRRALGPTPLTRETEFVREGTRPHVAFACSSIAELDDGRA